MDEVHSLSLYIIKVPVGSFRFHESLTAINKDLRLADLFMHDVTNNNSNDIGTNNSKIKKNYNISDTLCVLGKFLFYARHCL